MKTRLSTLAAALALSVAIPAAAFAQTSAAPAITPIGAAESIGWQSQPYGFTATGGVDRGLDSSAKGGNASQPERAVPQYGNTSGGPAY